MFATQSRDDLIHFVYNLYARHPRGIAALQDEATVHARRVVKVAKLMHQVHGKGYSDALRAVYDHMVGQQMSEELDEKAKSKRNAANAAAAALIPRPPTAAGVDLLLTAEDGSTVSREEFMSQLNSKLSLLYPACAAQGALRRGVLGEAFWRPMQARATAARSGGKHLRAVRRTLLQRQRQLEADVAGEDDSDSDNDNDSGGEWASYGDDVSVMTEPTIGMRSRRSSNSGVDSRRNSRTDRRGSDSSSDISYGKGNATGNSSAAVTLGPRDELTVRRIPVPMGTATGTPAGAADSLKASSMHANPIADVQNTRRRYSETHAHVSTRSDSGSTVGGSSRRHSFTEMRSVRRVGISPQVSSKRMSQRRQRQSFTAENFKSQDQGSSWKGSSLWKAHRVGPG